jgi:hypothetical protein
MIWKCWSDFFWPVSQRSDFTVSLNESRSPIWRWLVCYGWPELVAESLGTGSFFLAFALMISSLTFPLPIDRQKRERMNKLSTQKRRGRWRKRIKLPCPHTHSLSASFLFISFRSNIWSLMIYLGRIHWNISKNICAIILCCVQSYIFPHAANDWLGRLLLSGGQLSFH